MKVIEYLKRHKKDIPIKACPVILFRNEPILYKMAKECCESSMKGACVEHFLQAELGDVE